MMSSTIIVCYLDPLPTVLLEECIDSLLSTIRNIINVSLRTGIVLDDFKRAHDEGNSAERSFK